MLGTNKKIAFEEGNNRHTFLFRRRHLLVAAAKRSLIERHCGGRWRCLLHRRTHRSDLEVQNHTYTYWEDATTYERIALLRLLPTTSRD